DKPAALILFEEVVHAAGAQHIDENAVDSAALADRHFRLRDRAIARDVAAESTVEVVDDAGAFIEAVGADLDEFIGGALEPCGVHPALGMPDRFEALPIAGIAPQDPVIQSFLYCEFLSRSLIHDGSDFSLNCSGGL